MITARKYIVTKTFRGLPKRENFEIVQYQLPPLQNNEILVKTEWISVDPYQRAINHDLLVPYDQLGFQIAVVQDSKDPRFPVGAKVISYSGWCDYAVLNTDIKSDPIHTIYRIPDTECLSPSLCIGAVGVTGATAYFGLLEICQPKPGETVVVTSAAGGVGSLVGQIAKIKGCKVIGFTGSDEKVHWLKTDLGFDSAFNYNNVDIAVALEEAAPEGVDCYFDNVGGEISTVIMKKMNKYGRVSVCGSISSYNDEILPTASSLQSTIVEKQLKIEGFLAFRWVDRFQESNNNLINWINLGKLVARETIWDGFDQIYDAFIAMLQGKNIGKTIVRI